MKSPEEFQKEQGKQTRKLTNYRINEETASFIEDFKGKHHFESTGKALEYIVASFKNAHEAGRVVSNEESADSLQLPKGLDFKTKAHILLLTDRLNESPYRLKVKYTPGEVLGMVAEYLDSGRAIEDMHFHLLVEPQHEKLRDKLPKLPDYDEQKEELSPLEQMVKVQADKLIEDIDNSDKATLPEVIPMLQFSLNSGYMLELKEKYQCKTLKELIERFKKPMDIEFDESKLYQIKIFDLKHAEATTETEGVDKPIYPELSWDIFKHPKIDTLINFRREEHKTPYDTLEFYKLNAEQSILELIHDPLRLITGDEYKELQRWDKEEFMPAMRQLTGIPDLELTGREKFLLIWDYAKADPVTDLTAILPMESLTTQVYNKLADLQFPRSEYLRTLLEQRNESTTQA